MASTVGSSTPELKKSEPSPGFTKIEQFDKAEVLAALYNAAHPTWLTITVETARALLTSDARYWDYYENKKLDIRLGLNSSEVVLTGYDKLHGRGLAERVISKLKPQNNGRNIDSSESHSAFSPASLISAPHAAFPLSSALSSPNATRSPKEPDMLASERLSEIEKHVARGTLDQVTNDFAHDLANLIRRFGDFKVSNPPDALGFSLFMGQRILDRLEGVDGWRLRMEIEKRDYQNANLQVIAQVVGGEEFGRSVANAFRPTRGNTSGFTARTAQPLNTASLQPPLPVNATAPTSTDKMIDPLVRVRALGLELRRCWWTVAAVAIGIVGAAAATAIGISLGIGALTFSPLILIAVFGAPLLVAAATYVIGLSKRPKLSPPVETPFFWYAVPAARPE